MPRHLSTKEVGNNITAFFSGLSPLSNFFKTNFTVDGHEFSSMEQFFQYRKATHAQKPEIAKAILNEDNPRDCKHLGDSVKCDENEWLPVAKGVMKQGCLAKFSQDMYANKFLIETGNQTLAEAGPNKMWGVGMYMNDKNIATKDKWTGQNLLGQILMNVRDEL